jgi:hypothetical protein
MLAGLVGTRRSVRTPTTAVSGADDTGVSFEKVRPSGYRQLTFELDEPTVQVVCVVPNPLPWRSQILPLVLNDRRSPHKRVATLLTPREREDFVASYSLASARKDNDEKHICR